MAHVYKRKQKQAMNMRGFENLEYLCNSMGVVRQMRRQDGNTYEQISDIFSRKLPVQPKEAPVTQ